MINPLFDMLDDELLRKESKEGFQLGYTGKQVIHPRQIPIVQESFSPDATILAWAKRVVMMNHQQPSVARLFHLFF